VHRDVKPGNLLVSDSDVVKLADFGIARATDQSSITQVGSVLGTAAYLAPEQARGDEAGPRADLYSLGVVTYQLISSRLPYEASSLSELALKQQRESPTPLSELVPAVPPALAEAVAVALSIDPADRPENAIELGDMLSDGAHGVPPRRRGGAGAPATAATRIASGLEQPTAATRAQPPSAPTTAQTRAANRGRSAARPAPRQVPPNRSPAAAVQARRPTEQTAPAPRRRGTRRLIGALAVLAVLALIVIAVVLIANSTSTTVVHYRKVVGSDVQQAINQMQQLLDKYTK
jgi:serine/threonine-protein kinase